MMAMKFGKELLASPFLVIGFPYSNKAFHIDFIKQSVLIAPENDFLCPHVAIIHLQPYHSNKMFLLLLWYLEFLHTHSTFIALEKVPEFMCLLHSPR